MLTVVLELTIIITDSFIFCYVDAIKFCKDLFSHIVSKICVLLNLHFFKLPLHKTNFLKLRSSLN